MAKEDRLSWWRYGAAFISVAVATLLRLSLSPILGERVPFILFFPAVVASAWFGGLWPGLISVALSTIIAWYIFLPPRFSLVLSDPTAPTELVIFVIANLFIVLLAENLHRTRRRVGESERGEREQRERLHVTLASISDAVIVTDVEGRVTFLNPVAQSLTGWTQKEAEGKPLEEVFVIVNEETRVAVENPVMRVRQTGLIAGLANHTVLVSKGGGDIPIDDYASPILDESGDLIGVVLIFRDITERRWNETARAYLAAIVESSDDAIVGKTLEGIITSWNRGAERILGYTAEEAIGKPITILIPPARQGEEERILERLKRGEYIEHFETVRLRKDGTKIDVSLSISPIYDATGKIIGASKIVRDIAERKQAEEALRESEERFRFLAETIPSIVWTAAPDGTITYVNQRWLKYCGITMEQNVRSWAELVLHPDDYERCVAQWSQCLQEGKEYEIEVRNRRYDGAYRWFVTRAVPLKNPDGQIVTWFGVTTDIHEQKQAEEASREADRHKNEFLAMLAHELRNPLAPIANAIKLMHRLGLADPQLRQMRDVIERQVEHMTRLVDDLLDVSRLTQGKITLHKERIDIRAVVNRAVETSGPFIEARRHKLSISLPPQPVSLEGDLTRLAQVVSNLLDNAAKYNEEGGHIWLTAECTNGKLAIRVQDDGMGMGPDTLPHVFDLFAQADRSLDRAQGGLGIGLTLVRRLVEMHGGHVEAASDGPGKGSEFIIHLPVLAEMSGEETTAPAKAIPTNSSTCYRILVVDDNVDSAESMALLLELEGHNVKRSYDGPTAVEAADKFHPQIALLDIGLPGMNGYEVARELRARPETKNAVLIAVSGYGQEEDRRRSKEAGFDHHLTKPVDYDALGALINSLILD